MKRRASSKEDEILARQRQLAARLQQQQQGSSSGGGIVGSQGATTKRPSTTAPAAAPKALIKRPSAAQNKPKAPPPPPKGRVTNSGSSASTNNNKSRALSLSSLTGGAVSSNLSKGKTATAAGTSGGTNNKQPIDLTKQSSGGSKKPSPPPPAKPAAPTLKRATKKRAVPAGAVVSAASTAALVEAARAKATGKAVVSGIANAAKVTTTSTSTGQGSKEIPSSGTSAPSRKASITGNSNGSNKPNDSSPTLKRKTLNASGSLLLANLMQNVADKDDILSAPVDTFPTIQPDDFWKHLREWDFLGQYFKATLPMTLQQQDDDNSDNKPIQKALPTTFVSARHYMASWAPLCLAECRAQIIQEVTTKAGFSNNNVPMIEVVVKTTSPKSKSRHINNRNGLMYDEDQPWLQGGGGMETGIYVVLQCKNPKHDRDWNFAANDIVLLVQPQYKDMMTDMTRGRTITTILPGKQIGEYSDCALVGHTEQFRGGVNGLIVKVSARKWAKIGMENMYLTSLGNNVTALREFTALCGTELLPLQQYLLGQHLQQDSSAPDGTGKVVKLSRHTSAEELLAKMGGTQALGPGFEKYARKKFNASQLTAIAASANEYGDGGFTLIKGPPGTGKTTTLCAVLNSLHIRQYNKYYEEVRRLAALPTGTRQSALENARKSKPRLLVCAPSNAAVDNIILKIMEDGFVDGQGQRYNPSMIRVGIGQSETVRAVSLETKIDSILSEHMDPGKLEASIHGYRSELQRISGDIARLRRRATAITSSCQWPLSKDWEIRIDEETFDETGRVYFVNHKEKMTTYDVPPPPEPGEAQFQAKSMPEYRSFMARIVKLVESYFSVKTHLERCTIVKGASEAGANQMEIRRNLETHVLDSVHMVMTTLGTSGNRTMEGVNKFEVVVVDEAAQSVEPATLSALHLGSRHAVLVGDPQQLPATIFNVSGRNSKYDRSLFQRLEEAGQPVYMLNEQYRMHPRISHFPRHIFYGGGLLDGPNVRQEGYGDPMLDIVCRSIPLFAPFTVLDLDSSEQRGGTSLSNRAECMLAVHLYYQMVEASRGLVSKSRVAVISPYSQQTKLMEQVFKDALGPRYADKVEVNTVDAFQGREASVVIFSAVRAAGSHGIGFLSDVRRMNVALTRAKHFLFVIARCESIVVNPYWRDLVQHARETNAVVRVPMPPRGSNWGFGSPLTWVTDSVKPTDPRKRKRAVF